MSIYRSFLFAPGNHARRVEKALSLSADAVILDLEDAVANSEKIKSRALVLAALQGPRNCKGYVRVNALGTPWSYGDLVAVIHPEVDGVLLPKVESASDLHTVEWLITSLENERNLPKGSIDLIPIVETALGFSNLASIARSGTRVRRIAFGAGDFTLDLGITWTSNETELLSYRNTFVVESRAAGLEPPLDTVWVALDDEAGFNQSVETVQKLGFQGKMCIHPNQLQHVNACFSPSEKQITHAKRVVEAFEVAEKQGLAAIQVDGQFVDYPIVYLAKKLIERANAIQKNSLTKN